MAEKQQIYNEKKINFSLFMPVVSLKHPSTNNDTESLSQLGNFPWTTVEGCYKINEYGFAVLTCLARH